VHLVFDIFQGIGVAAAVGIRPFLPALAVGGLAAGDVQIDFAHTSFDFLQSVPFLVGMAVGAVVLLAAERRWRGPQMERGPLALIVAGLALAIGALIFAGSLCRGGYVVWPGLIGGIVCAAVGIVATLPLLARVRSRLDEDAQGFLPMFAEATAVVAAVLSIVLPPVGVIVLALLLWLLLAARGQGEQKYAGLRILR
jgi:hypothetical protein